MTADLDVRDAGDADVVLDGRAPRVQLGRHVPSDEERQTCVAGRVVDAGASPPELSAVWTGTGAGLDLQPQPGGGRLELGVGHTHREPPIAAACRQRQQRSTERRGTTDVVIDHSDQLHVVGAQRHDAIAGAPSRMHATEEGRQSVVSEQPPPCLVEVRHREHHMIDRVHRSPSGQPVHSVISRYRRSMRRARFLVMILVLARLVPGPAGAATGDLQPLLEELTFPTNMAFLPDGKLLFTEKDTGSVRVVTEDGELVDRPFITLPVIPDAERGLLGIAVHPNFEREPWIYLYRSDPADGLNRLVRVRAEGTVAAGEPQTILDGPSAVAGYHNGGDLAFGADGTLFVALGEAHESDRAQDPDDIGGKVVRLTSDGGVPAGNPFDSDNPVWSIGHRNSFGLCVDPETGELWETENGPNVDDEVNLIEPGANYGWPLVTGRADDDRFVDPIVVFPEPIALTGCAVVDGDVWFGSFDGRLWRLRSEARDAGEPDEIARLPAGVTDVVLGPDGLLYVATADSIWAVEPSTDEAGGLVPEEADEPSPWRAWIAAAAIAVVIGALGVRFAVGRQLRRTRPGDDEG